MDLPVGLFAGLAQCGQEQSTIGIINEDGLTAVTPVHDVINRPWVLNSEFASHPEE